MDDILITDALIVTCDGNHSIIENGVMAVNNGKITALERSNTSAAKKLTAKKIIGANGNILMPGLINMHCHYFRRFISHSFLSYVLFICCI